MKLAQFSVELFELGGESVESDIEDTDTMKDRITAYR